MEDRFRVLRIFFVFLFAGVLIRLFYWQIAQGPRLRAEAQAQYEKTSTTLSTRGRIFSSEGYPLSMNIDTYTLFATPKVLSLPPAAIAAQLIPILFVPTPEIATQPAMLDLSRNELQLRLQTKLQTDKSWVSLQTGLTKSQKESIDNLHILGLGFDTISRRYYPEASLSAQILGFVGKDQEGEDKGYFGIEGQYDLELAGSSSITTQETDALGHPIAIGELDHVDALQSRDITLTIRRDIQFLVEQQLKQGVEKYGAKSADAIIMEPKTGKIIAMAGYPTYDPSTFASEDPKLFRNPTVADSYEPGSTFKIITVSSGIDLGLISPDTTCDSCAGPVHIGAYTIRTWNDEYHPNISMNDALAKSDNTAMVFAAKKIGQPRFLSYIKAFGFGQKTGVDLQEEMTPHLREDNKWGEIDLATSSFGQGIAVTAIQMVNAAAAIANNGLMMKPLIVEKVATQQQTFVTSPLPIRQVIKPETAKIVQDMMVHSANSGDAHWTVPKGYSVAGKTGTAQVPIDGHYDPQRTIASFIGFAPAQDAKFVMLVRMVEPKTSQWGSETAAPLWFSIAKELFVKLDIPKEN